jgi:PAS domain S-box-containing protein
MNDEDKTKEQLKLELARLRQRIAELEGQETERKHAEEEIIHLASFPELNPSPVLELDQEGNLIYLNPATKNIFPNLATLGVNHPFLADWTQVVKELQGSNWGKTVVREVVADGLFYEQVILPVTEKRIRIDGRNITKRKQAEENIRRLAMVVRDSNDAITIHDLEGRITAWNRGAKLMYGYSEEEALQMDIWHLAPTDKEVEQKEFFRRLMAGEAIYSLETQRVTKAGRILDTWLTVTKLVDDGGTIIWIASTERDITERKRAEEALRESEERFRAIFDNVADGILIADIETGKFYSGNKAICQMLGYSLEELRNLGVTDIHPEEDVVYNLGQFEKLSKRQISKSGDIRVKRKDSSVFYAEVNASPVTFRGKTYLISTFRDITERKKMQEQLVVQDRLASIGELASGIAHEINNPLTGILGLSELILDTNVPADVREDLKTIHSEAQRTVRIVQNLLAFARKQPQEKQSINVNDSISKVLELRAYEQKVSNINMITRFAPDLPEVKANAFQLQQVFINIIINAEYFMIKAHNRGTLTIATEQVDNIVRISIADDGPGIVKKNLLRMFSPFFTTKEVGKGTGLGLSICHGIVTEHDGRIYAESEVGKGATFIIELPIVPVGSGGTEK